MPDNITNDVTLFGFGIDNMAFIIPATEAQKRAAEYAQATANLVTAQQDITTRDATITTLTADLLAAEDGRDIDRGRIASFESMLNQLDDLLKLGTGDHPVQAVMALLTERDNLRKRVRELEASAPVPPVVVPPVIPPVIEIPTVPEVPPTSTPELSGTGFTLTTDETPGLNQDTAAGENMRLGASMGFEWARWYRNAAEVQTDVKRRPDDPRNLFALAQKLHLKIAADTMDVPALQYGDAQLAAYQSSLEDLGVSLWVVNDANQYREMKNPDGSLKYAPGTLERLVERLRKNSKLPIMASLTASAAIGAYGMFDVLEAQCFGRIGELDDFLKRPFGAFCFDARESVTLDYLMKAHDVTLQYPPRFAWWYTAWFGRRPITDWRQMPEKVRIIEGTVKALREKQKQNSPS
jgi:hypothetical protein